MKPGNRLLAALLAAAESVLLAGLRYFTTSLSQADAKAAWTAATER